MDDVQRKSLEGVYPILLEAARRISYRYAPRHLRDELLSEMLLAMAECAHRWNPDRGVSLVAYSRPRMVYAAIDWGRRTKGWNRLTKERDFHEIPHIEELDPANHISAEKWLVLKEACRELRITVPERELKAMVWNLKELAAEEGITESRASHLRRNGMVRVWANPNLVELLEEYVKEKPISKIAALRAEGKASPRYHAS